MIDTAKLNHQEQEISIIRDSVRLKGNLVIPNQAQGVVLFAHGSGSNRFSLRNRHVAKTLQRSGLATLPIDLLTPAEEEIDRRTGQLRFNIGLLGERLVDWTKWLLQNPNTEQLKIGYFGASTGSAAALLAAADFPDGVGAIVSRGGRPDLVGSALSRVKAPTLLIVGGRDLPAIEMNRKAFAQLRSEKEMVIIPGATHLFEEAGALQEVARLSSIWFNRYFSLCNKPNQ